MRKRRIVSLGSSGQLVLRSGGSEQPLEVAADPRGVAYIAIDHSGSMGGQKLQDARRGAAEFTRDAVATGYTVGVVAFATAGRKLLTPTLDPDEVSSALASVAPSGSTNMQAAILLATEAMESVARSRAIVLVTDGRPDDPEATRCAAERAKRLGIQIITIGTEDADIAFLKTLATGSNLAISTTDSELESAIGAAARKLALPSQAKENG